MAIKITIGTKNQIFKTIGHNEKYEPVLFYKIGQRKQAIADLTDFYNKFGTLVATGIQFEGNDSEKYFNQFKEMGRLKAMEIIERIEENETMYQDRFFAHLR